MNEAPDVIQLGEEAGSGSALAIPVFTVPAVYEDPIKLAVKRAMLMEITTAEDYKAAAENVNMLGKFKKFIKEHALALGRPLRDRAAKITADGDKYIDELQPAYDIQAKRMLVWKLADDAKIAAAAEAQRLERVRLEQEAHQREVERQRLLAEANAKEELAAKGIEAGATKEDIDKAVADGKEAQALLAQAAAIPEPSSIPFIPQAPLPQATTAKGVKMDKRVILDSADVTKLPAAYLVVNEVLLKKHLKDGLSVPGCTFHFEEFISGTGR